MGKIKEELKVTTPSLTIFKTEDANKIYHGLTFSVKVQPNAKKEGFKNSFETKQLRPKTWFYLTFNFVYLLSIFLFLIIFCNAITAQTFITTIKVDNPPTGVGVNNLTNRIYVFGCNDVNVIDGFNVQIIDTVQLPTFFVGQISCGRGVVDPLLNRIYTTTSVTSKWPPDGSVNEFGFINVIDGLTNNLISQISVESHIDGIAINPAKNLIYISNGNKNIVSVINGSTNEIIFNIAVGDQPRGIGINPSTNRIYVTNMSDDNISVPGIKK